MLIHTIVIIMFIQISFLSELWITREWVHVPVANGKFASLQYGETFCWTVISFKRNVEPKKKIVRAEPA